MPEVLKVVAGLMIKNDQILIAQRAEKKYNGSWEFPGGKIETPESPASALRRELQEELDIKVKIGAHFMDSMLKITADKSLHLSAYFVFSQDTPKALEHKDIKWVPINQLLNYSLLPADIPIAKQLIKTKKTKT